MPIYIAECLMGLMDALQLPSLLSVKTVCWILGSPLHFDKYDLPSGESICVRCTCNIK